ncbi:MFS transporter [Halosimplex halophilum]|uniref:MFS transporter n=1 Tax=Halosimplex halophilum TaxID=2559572 RepID=UPI00107FC971|nr:MFS transporter [Halosimplex halophilum]
MTRRQLFGSLCAMVFVVNLGRVVFAPLLDPLRAALTVDAAAVGLLASLVWVGSAVPRIPTGYLLTRVPRHYVVFATGATLTAATALASVAPGIRALQAAALLMGAAGGAYFIAANPLVSELFPSRVGSALGVHGTAAQLAAVGAPLFVTAVLARGEWPLTFRIMAAVTAVATVLFTVAAWRTDLPAAGTEDRHLLVAVREQWRLVLAGVVMLGATGFVWQGVFNFYPTYLAETKSLTESTARTVLSVVFGAGVPAMALSGRLADRLDIVRYILALLGGFVVTVLALTTVSGLVAVVAVSLVLGYVTHSLFPAMDTYLLGSLPDRHRASAYAAYSGTMMFVQAGGSYAVGFLRDAQVAFDLIFRSFAGGLVVVLAALLVAHAMGRLPHGARS